MLSVALSSCAEEGEHTRAAEKVADSVAQEREQLVKLIEESIALPEHSRDIDSYSRYYAMRQDGSVLATYIIHMPLTRESVAEACRETEGDWFPCPLNGGELRLVEAGDSAWVDDPLDMPVRLDGGCSLVTIEYRPDEARFLRVECNGAL